MRIFAIRVGKPESYGWTENHAKYHEEYRERRESYLTRLKEWQDTWVAMGITIDPDDGRALINDQQLMDLFAKKVDHTVEKEIPVPKSGPDAFLSSFEAIANKLLAAPVLSATDYNHGMYNERVNIHMPGNALSSYNEIMLMEDACSDALQSELDKGFRIIAACPQPDKRRPDYVLGRFNPNKTPQGDALRK